jgi:hypothetical protein
MSETKIALGVRSCMAIVGAAFICSSMRAVSSVAGLAAPACNEHRREPRSGEAQNVIFNPRPQRPQTRIAAPFRSARITTIGCGQVHRPFVMPIPPQAE